MRLVVRPGSRLEGRVRVAGDKSVAHRWLILAATARGRSRLGQVPPSLDVVATARCLASLAPKARPGLERWSSNVAGGAERNGFTWDVSSRDARSPDLDVEAEGRDALIEPDGVLDCANSGTTMRLLAGLLASAPFRSTLVGDESLTARPMERVAEPLRLMGADVRTTDGHAPVEVAGGDLTGIRYRTPVPSAQVKSAILLAGCAARGVTEVSEPAPTRDHTERALEALGGPVERSAGRVRLSAFQHGGFEAVVPGDPSSAAFLAVGAAVTGGEVEIAGVGLNPTRTFFLEVLRRMGVEVEISIEAVELGEPVGRIVARGPAALRAVEVTEQELPLVIDEVPVLAAGAAYAEGDSRFAGGAELRVKESDRLEGLAASMRALGARALVEGDDLIVVGAKPYGGRTHARGDHRMAMAMAILALGARDAAEIDGAEAASVSFPGFADALRAVGADVAG